MAVSPTISTIASVSSTGKLMVAGVITTTSVATNEDRRVEEEHALVEIASLHRPPLHLVIILHAHSELEGEQVGACDHPATSA